MLYGPWCLRKAVKLNDSLLIVKELTFVCKVVSCNLWQCLNKHLHCNSGQWKQCRPRAGIMQNSGLLHTPCLEALGHPVGYETWPPGDWHHPFGWSKYRLGLPLLQWILDSHDQWEFPPFFRSHWQSPCTTLMAGKCLPKGLCKVTVKESSKILFVVSPAWF